MQYRTDDEEDVIKTTLPPTDSHTLVGEPVSLYQSSAEKKSKNTNQDSVIRCRSRYILAGTAVMKKWGCFANA